MSIEDEIFWLIINIPAIPCIVSFILGGIIATITMIILNHDE
jgi:riboflavin transporter FmnP